MFLTIFLQNCRTRFTFYTRFGQAARKYFLLTEARICTVGNQGCGIDGMWLGRPFLGGSYASNCDCLFRETKAFWVHSFWFGSLKTNDVCRAFSAWMDDDGCSFW